MNLIDYQNFVEKLASASSTASFKDRLLTSVLGLCGESGECLDLLYDFINHDKEIDKTKLIDELGDVIWYVTFACNIIDNLSLDKLVKFDITTFTTTLATKETVLSCIMNLVSYSGKCSDFVKKHVYHSKDFNEDQFVLKLGYIVDYVNFLCCVLDVSFQHLIDVNVAKLQSRYATGKFTVEEFMKKENAKIE